MADYDFIEMRFESYVNNAGVVKNEKVVVVELGDGMAEYVARYSENLKAWDFITNNTPEIVKRKYAGKINNATP